MYERSYGSNYDKDRPVKEDAAIIRRKIKELVKAGKLPADWKYSVRYRTASMMRAIDVVASSPGPTLIMAPVMLFAGPEPREVEVPIHGEMRTLALRAGESHEVRWMDVVKPLTKSVHDTLKDLVDSYNHDGSDSMTDYYDRKFWGGVNVESMNDAERFDTEAPARFLPVLV